ncbi:hypothetical protein ACFF1C_000583 [Enterobacter roggenkampii]
MSWTTSISNYTILQKSIPELTTYISVGVVIGALLVIRAFFVHAFNQTLKYFANTLPILSYAVFALGLY